MPQLSVHLNDQLNIDKHDWLLSQKVTLVTSHLLYYSMCSICPPPAQTRAQVLMPLANSTFSNCATQRGPLAVDASFQSIDVRDIGIIDSLLNTLHTV